MLLVDIPLSHKDNHHYRLCVWEHGSSPCINQLRYPRILYSTATKVSSSKTLFTFLISLPYLQFSCIQSCGNILGVQVPLLLISKENILFTWKVSIKLPTRLYPKMSKLEIAHFLKFEWKFSLAFSSNADFLLFLHLHVHFYHNY